jgi:hypothetical protein
MLAAAMLAAALAARGVVWSLSTRSSGSRPRSRAGCYALCLVAHFGLVVSM